MAYDRTGRTGRNNQGLTWIIVAAVVIVVALIIIFFVLPGGEEADVVEPVDVEEGIGEGDAVDPVDVGEEDAFLPSLRHFVIDGVEIRAA